VWFYAPVLAAGLLPASLLFPGLARFLLSGSNRRKQQRAPEMSFFLLAGGWCVLFFSLSGSKLPTYIVPALPMLLLVLGCYVAAGARPRRMLAGVLLAGGAAALAWLHYDGLPWYARVRSPMRDTEQVERYCSDPRELIVCFPRSCDSLAFYLRRDDLYIVRSKESVELLQLLQQRQRTVLLFTHRSSLDSLRGPLAAAGLNLVEVVSFQREKSVGQWFDVLSTETPWGLCDLAVVEKMK
jgi:hypothetical protein